ncbi:PO21 protein, partial [Oxylabes madagascariensis]|nr:PO21 protein [Oxylabes madagascariensis]
KAFDTICHQHIIMGLVWRGIDPHVVHLVTEVYKNITTYIDTRGDKMDPIGILAGVTQGDPMSPVLFNLVLDPLLCRLETEGQGFHRGGLRITAMAFSDDLVLLSDSWEGMCSNIKILETFCELTGLHTQGER